MAAIYSHARQLRTIGQQLDRQGIELFDLRYVDGDYFLECADPNPPFLDLIHLQFSAFDLKSLELAAAQARSPGFTQVNFQSMAETLRATGRYLERFNAKLIGISTPDGELDGTLFKIEYETRDGRRRVENILNNALSDIIIRMYKERARIAGASREPSSST